MIEGTVNTSFSRWGKTRQQPNVMLFERLGQFVRIKNCLSQSRLHNTVPFVKNDMIFLDKRVSERIFSSFNFKTLKSFTTSFIIASAAVRTMA